VAGSADKLIIRNLTITYRLPDRGLVQVLNDLSLEVHDGEVLGILGESGCGKSTLAHSVLRILPSNAKVEKGQIVLRGRDLLGLSDAELRSIRGRDVSLIPQEPALSLNPVMKVGTQIAEVLRAHVSQTSHERRERVRELLREVGFQEPAEIYDAYPHQLSGGQRQRIAIAQAIACRPGLVICDEPTSKLDAALRRDIADLLLSMRNRYGSALVVISHDPSFLAMVADRIALMYAGQIVEVGGCADVFARPLHPYSHALVEVARTLMGTGEKLTHFARIPGESPDPKTINPGCNFEPRCADRMEKCAQCFPRTVTPEPGRAVSCFKYDE
jgi:peptide/nickel transport system ATP-binding protein